MLRVYIAGPMSADNPIAFLENLRLGQKLAAEAVNAGFAVMTPFTDLLLFFQEPIAMTTIKASSLAWLEVAEAVLVQELGASRSEGTKAERERAQELGIPVFTSLKGLQEWAAKQPT